MIIEIGLHCSGWLHVSIHVARNVIAKVLSAHRSGDHLVIVHRSFADWATGIELGAQDDALLKRLKGEFTTSYGLLQKAESYLSIEPSPLALTNTTGAKIRIGAQNFLETRIAERPLIIVENIAADGDIYGFVLREMPKDTGNPWISYEIEHGSGDYIHHVFDRKISEKKVICAIIDTDHVAPTREVCGKERRINEVLSKCSWPLSVVAVLPCQEVENLIPLEALRKFLSKETIKTYEKLERIKGAEDRAGTKDSCRFHLFFDMKKGISIESLSKISDEKQARWVRERFIQAGVNLEEEKIEGFGEGIMQRVMNDRESIKNFRDHINTDAWKKVFLGVFMKIYWLCIASKKQYIT